MVRQTGDLLQEALALHRRGSVAEAAVRYSALLQDEPHHAEAHYYLGLIACQQGRFGDGAERARQALTGDLRHARAHTLLGRALAALGQKEEALASFDRALALAPELTQAHGHRADVLNDLGRHGEAVEAYDRALAAAPDRAEDLFNRGTALAALGRHAEAVASFERAIAVRPDDPQAYLCLARSLSEVGRHAAALAALDRALAIAPRFAEAWQGRGNVCLELKRYDDALSAFDQALAIKPALAGAWLGRGNAFREIKRRGDAAAAYDKALTLDPGLAAAWLGRGNVSFDLRHCEAALAAYEHAAELDHALAAAWLGRGNVCLELKRYDDALSAFDKALALKPVLGAAWLGRGTVFRNVRQYGDAAAAYDKALTLDPGLAAAWLGRGNVLFDLRHYEAALAAYERAAELDHELAAAWFGQAAVMATLRRYEEASTAFDKAFRLDRALQYLAGQRIHVKLLLCDWRGLEEDVIWLLDAVREGIPASDPFPLLAVSSSAADQLRVARRYVEDQLPFPPLWRGDSYRHDRIRVAYLSADFSEHPVARLLIGLLERHDRSHFEVTAISLGSAQNSPLRQRITDAVDHFIDVKDDTDEKIAALIRRQEIDIAVDLMGFNENGRPGILARRPAPIQINYLGLIGTMAAPFIDYVIADEIALPFDQQPFFGEKIVHLPDCFLPTDDRQEIASRTPSREQVGLPPEGFVFCSFNNSYKFNQPMFEAWMRLLQAVPGSVLWLAQSNREMIGNLRRQAERCSIDPGRIVFAPRVSHAEHLARQRLAGLFLDTIPYNAGATGAAALWSGVPLLTVRGETFVGRMAASMLHAVGLRELVTHSLAEYEALAYKIAMDPALCAGLKDKLARNRSSHPLFDTGRFARNIEQAYTTMVDLQRHGEAPRSFRVPS